MSTKSVSRTIVVLVYLSGVAAVITLAVVAVLAQRDLTARMDNDRPAFSAMQREFASLDRRTWALDEQVRANGRADRQALASIRRSLDHITIRVHVPPCCAGLP